jgi:ectoine hydroxylase-related dioxygenase (phytanoyl-CoA dioxygenase family)
MDRPDLGALDTAGHLLVPGALDPARVARLRLAFPAPAPGATGTQHVTIDDATPAADEWRALADHPLLRAAAARVLGPDFHVRDAHGRNPLPGHGLQGLHADWPARAPGEPFSVLTALWLLDDFTAANGATRIEPGTHLLTRPVPRDLARPHARHPDERIVTGPAGAVQLINGHLWHAGRQNTGPGPRRCVQMVVHRGPRPTSA